MEDLETYGRLALALGVGLLVGIERGWRRRGAPEGARTAGVRTFTLIGLFGGLIGVAGPSVGEAVTVAAFVALVLMLVAGYAAEYHRTQNLSITSEVTGLIVFILGVMAVRGDIVITAMGAVVVVAILDLREASHEWVEKVSKAELSAGIMLLAISVLVLPLLPNRGFGPGEVLNPYELWWMVVLISAMAFLGHAAIRLTGPKAGIVLMGIFGGLSSSTAVTVAAARMAKEAPSHGEVLASGIAAASVVMFLRALVITVIWSPEVAMLVAAPLLFGALASAGLTFLWMRDAPKQAKALALTEPSDIATAIKFGLVLAVVTLATYYARRWFGDQGLVATAAFAGLVDVDAVIVSMARQADASSPVWTAVAALTAVMVNTAAKMTYASIIAGPVLRRRCATLFIASAAAVGAGFAVSAAIA